MKNIALAAAMLLLATPLFGDVVTRRLTALKPGGDVGTAGESPASAPVSIVRFDLSSLPAGATILRADLVPVRSACVRGNEDEALVKTLVYALFQGGVKPAPDDKPLAIRGPWFDRLDATAAVRRWAGGKSAARFLVQALVRCKADESYLDVWYEGKAGAVPPAVADVKARHRAGLTFITWKELEDPFGPKLPVLDELRAAAQRSDSARQVRYRIYRHSRPIDRQSIAQAELLAEVAPLSAYNVRGVSPDHVIHQRQRRAIDDGLFARGIAHEPFEVSPQSAEMGQIAVERLAIEDGTPLPPGVGLYVHQGESPGKAFYAVVTCIDGVANMVDLTSGAGLAEPLAEDVGPGEPVFQKIEDLKVFYDYPGQRMHYVQWCSPATAGTLRSPAANLPNQYYNWSVYVPPGAERKDPLALGIYFHDWRGLYLRARWPHLPDQILVATNDAPWPSFGYGYHESLGTLKSFGEGMVRDYTAVRIDQFVAWVKRKHAIDPARISCHGLGTLGGTAAVHFGLRHAEATALVVAGYFDANPGACTATVPSDQRQLRTHLPEMEAVWGKQAWAVKTVGGKSIWSDRDLTSLVLSNRRQRLPFLSIGAGTSSAVWAQQNPFMKALLEARQPFIAEFDWGGSPPRYGPTYVRRDQLMLAQHPAKMDFADRDYWAKAKVGYSSGGAINSNLSWQPDGVIDTPERLEVAGDFSGAVTLRNARQFVLIPNEKVRWTLDTGQRDKRGGEAAADQDGILTIPGLSRGKITITRVQ
jgi:hypothetical protein